MITPKELMKIKKTSLTTEEFNTEVKSMLADIEKKLIQMHTDGTDKRNLRTKTISSYPEHFEIACEAGRIIEENGYTVMLDVGRGDVCAEFRISW